MKPLLHFVLIGAACFMLSRWAPPITSSPRRRGSIRYDERENEQMDSRLRGNDGENVLLAAAIARHIGDDDIVVQRRLLQNARSLGLTPDGDVSVYRTALTLGLAAGDPIIERRLVQQMRLQLEDEARSAEPTDAELQRYLADHADRLALPERVRVTHLFFSLARRGEHAETDARVALKMLSQGSDVVGDPSLWPPTLPLQTATDLEKIFGTAATVIAAAPLHRWRGPYQSALGYHLARIDEREPQSLPPFTTVREALRLAWLNERAEAHVREIAEAPR